MTKNLVIAEKKLAAFDMAKAFGKKPTDKGGYLEDDENIFTWAQGHLLQIAPHEKQGNFEKKWSLDQLPILVDILKQEVSQTGSKQFKIIKSLAQRKDVSTIICATDAGREGVLIFKRIYDQLKLNTPYTYLWPSDLTEESLKKAYSNQLPAEAKENVAKAAYARSQADWFFGINFTHFYTVKIGEFVSIGRVQTPVLAFLVHRLKEIADFKPETFFTIDTLFQSHDGEVKTKWFGEPYGKGDDRISSRAAAEAVETACKTELGTVITVDKKDSKMNPPKLFDLTLLQREANNKYGYSAKKTLELAQELYSGKKVLSYPRTDSCYLSDELFAEVEKHISSARANFESIADMAASCVSDAKGNGKKFTCVNSGKVTDHHAIIPTAQPAEQEKLSEEEWNIYEMVCRRFLAVFLPPAQVQKSIVWVEINEHRFKANGTIYQSHGWMEAEPDKIGQDNVLPDLEEGHTLTVNKIEIKEGKTTPPPHYNESSILGAMETAGKEVDDEAMSEAMKERGLGTPATRASIIETLISRGYIERKGKNLLATEKGVGVIESVEELHPVLASPELTGGWEHKLRLIEKGELDYDTFMASVKEKVQVGIETVKDIKMAYTAQKPEKDVIGVCPACGGEIYDKGKAYGCSNWKEKQCKVTIWKKTAGATVTKTDVKQLLTNGQTKKKKKMKSNAGKDFEAYLYLNSQHKVEFKF